MSDQKTEITRGLASLLQKPILTGVWYNGKGIQIDGYKFVACRFDNCELYVNSATFDIERCFIDSSTKIIYGSDPLKVIRLFNKPYEWFYVNAPVFAPTRHNDGTVSVSGQS